MILYLEILGLGLGLYALLAFLGWIPWRLLIAGRDLLPFVVAAPLFGLGVLSAFGWYWLEYGSGGMASGLPVLIGLDILASGVVLIRLRGRFWAKAPSGRAMISAGLLSLVVFAGVAFHYHDGLHGELTAASPGNNDIASYSVISQNLQHEGYDNAGPIVGNDLGGIARVDSSGALVLLASSAEVSGLRTYETTIPIIGLAALLVALACACLAARIVPGSPTRSVVIGLAAIAPYMFVYNATEYFLSQVLSIAPVVAMLVVYLNVAARRDRTSVAHGTAAIALLTVPMLLTYPHMAALAQPVILGIAWVADGHRDLPRRAARLAICAISGLSIAVIGMLPAVSGAIDRARALADVNAGWPLGLLSPLQTLGFQRFPAMWGATPPPGPSSLRYLAEAVVVGAVLAGATLALVRAGQSHAWLGGAAAVVVFASYRVVYQAEGYSYRQWKWVSFFQPILSTAIVAVVCAAVLVVLHHFELGRYVPAILGVAAAAVWIGLLTARAHTLTGVEERWTSVSPELVGLESVGTARLRVVNVDVAPYWETMWGAYFVAPVPSRLAQESYFARAPQTARWTVRSTRPGPSEPAPTPALAERRIDREYELACGREPCALRLSR